MSKKTGWINGDLSPIRPGVYERDFAHGKWAKWDGEQWWPAWRDVERARASPQGTEGPSGIQPWNCIDATDGRWRGLAKKP